MAMITGRVQINESTKPRDIMVGKPFARKNKVGWESLDGTPLKSTVVETSEIKKRLRNKRTNKQL